MIFLCSDSKRWLIPVTLCMLVFSLPAQDPAFKQDDLQEEKQKPENLSFGFCFGMSNFLLKLREADIYHAAPGYQDSINTITARGKMGLMVGVMVEWKMNQRFAVRTNPSILFNNYAVYYNRTNGRTDFMVSENSFLEIPVHLAYRWPSKKIIPLMWAGSSFKFDYTKPKDARSLTRFWSLDAAFSFEKKLGRMVVAPEIRYSLALSDVTLNRRMDMPTLMDRMRLNTIYLVLNFKG